LRYSQDFLRNRLGDFAPWSAITTSQNFINSFATRSLASRPSVLLAVRKGDILFVFSYPVDKNSSDGQFTCVGSYQLANPNFGNLFRYYYVHGLIFFEGTKQLVICNCCNSRTFSLSFSVFSFFVIEGKQETFIPLKLHCINLDDLTRHTTTHTYTTST